MIGRLGTVKQKLIKLFVDVSEATCPATGGSWPSVWKPLAITRGSRAVEGYVRRQRSITTNVENALRDF